MSHFHRPCPQVCLVGWGPKFDEWLPVHSARIAKLNTRSNGARGILFVDSVVFDQEITVEGDDADPPSVYAVARRTPRRSALLISNLNYFLGASCNGAARWLVRLKDMERPVPLDVRVGLWVCGSMGVQSPRAITVGAMIALPCLDLT